MLIRIRRLTGTAALVAASALALAGCGDGAGDRADRPPASATAARGGEPEPAASSATTTAAPTPTAAVAVLGDQTGRTINQAIAAADGRGLDYAVYLQGTGLTLSGGGRQASSWGAGEEVCGQVDDPADVNSSYDVAFTIPRDGRDCAGAPLHTPAPTTAPATGDGSGGGSTGGGSTGGSTGGGSTGSGSTGGGSTGSGSTGGGGGTACAITSPAGNCYADGQFCATRHRGLSTYGRGGEYLTCAQDGAGRWRWSDGVTG
ncbi:hypothetical protein [Streptomyces leeuwenhoekii]|uniref:Secreted Protein n=1 Tax=Streptomyces leeuwenhoekii TaxID=1437453 RepID=A0A0F7VSD6_STRLW|nr:hypothetical protein [Streptomyces leeuwenhoekii]CQR63369.1 Secreted Protein [Streptomyces leeuwenhoekii]